MAEPRILPSADLDDGIQIGDGSSIWHLAQVRGGAEIGENVIVGRGAYIGSGVHVGDNCKIQNYALVYEPAHLEDGVFIGPAAVLTNDTFPRAVNPDGTSKSAHDWEPVGVTLKAVPWVRAPCASPLSRSASGRRSPPAPSSPVTFPPTRWWPGFRPGASNGWAAPVSPSRKPVPTHSVTRTPATSSSRWARPSTS